MGDVSDKDDRKDLGLEKETPAGQLQVGSTSIANPEHPGRNDDKCLVVELAGGKSALIAVSDGVGRGGPMSGQAAETVLKSLASIETKVSRPPTTKQAGELLKNAIYDVSERVKEIQASAGNTQTDTTVVAGLIAESPDETRKYLVTANVGDSRIYIFKPGINELAQVTRDDSIVQELIEAGRITPEEAQGYKTRNIITKTVGSLRQRSDVTVKIVPLEEEDVVLAVTDGFSDNFDLRELPEKVSQTFGEISRGELDSQGAAEELAQKALSAMKDNRNPLAKMDDVSVVVLGLQKFNRSVKNMQR